GDVERTAYGGEDVVEVVRHAACQGAHRLELLDLLELEFQVPAIGDVLQDTLDPHHVALAVGGRSAAEDEMPHRAVLMNEHSGIIQENLTAADLPELPDVLICFLPTCHDQEALAGELMRCITQDLLHHRVYIGYTSPLIEA